VPSPARLPAGLRVPEGDYPVAEKALDQTIALPMHCDLTDDEIRRVIHAVSTVCA
jgi:dTDP-4-amino-4,6-dideoxygalactose transaminase